MSERKQLHILYAIIAALLVCLLSLTYVYAKYVREVPLEGEVIISGQLATKLELFESAVKRQTDGTYKLLDTEVTESQSYILMPGVDVPKDPQIRITGKTAIPGYLFVEVVDSSLPAKVTYTMADCWLDTSLTGANGGTVYVYASGTTPVILNNTNCSDTFNTHILENDILDVKDSFAGGSGTLLFNAYLYQKIGSAEASLADAQNSFTNNQPTTAP